MYSLQRQIIPMYMIMLSYTVFLHLVEVRVPGAIRRARNSGHTDQKKNQHDGCYKFHGKAVQVYVVFVSATMSLLVLFASFVFFFLLSQHSNYSE